MPTTTHPGDPANGWEAMAHAIIDGREHSTIGVAVLRDWARVLPAGASVLDLGCGSGVPVSRTLVDLGFAVSAVDASPRMVAAYRARFPHVPTACEPAEASDLFGRTFDAVVSVGMLFLLGEAAQREVIRRVAAAVVPGGRLLFTAPWQTATWTDPTTGREMRSLGRAEYVTVLETAGFALLATPVDEGENHYFSVARVLPSRSG